MSRVFDGLPLGDGSLDDLLGAYALDALDADERRAVENYIAVNPQARAEVREHQEVATFLAYSGASAPEGLWDRISLSLDDRAPAPGPELARVLPMRRTVWQRAGGWVAATAAAAAVAVIAVGVIDRNEPASDPIVAAVEDARGDRDSRIVTLALEGADETAEAIVDQDGHGYLLAGGLPTLSADRTYQLWGVVNGQVISLGILGNNPEVESFSVDGSLTALVITDEAAGGVPVSEQPALWAAEI